MREKTIREKITQVTWTDASLAETSDEAETVLTKSIGFLVAKDKNCVKLAQSKRLDDDSYVDILTIPKRMIKVIK